MENVNANTTLNLCHDGGELSTSSKLAELGIKDSSELILISSTENKGFTMKLQTLLGQVFEFRFETDATLKDLYEAIYLKTEFTRTFTLLFNHRMHIFQSTKFLAEPIFHFLSLTSINKESFPHFYIFECDRTFETRKYEYTKNFREKFLQSDLRQPRSGKQTDLAMPIYLNSIPTNTDAEKEGGSDKYFVEPVRLLNDKIVNGTCNRFVLVEYDEVQTQYQLTENDYQRQTDLIGLLMFLKNFEMLSNNNESSQQRDLFEQYSSDYTLRVPNTNIDLLSIGNVSEQKQNLKCFSDHDLHEKKQQLSTNDLLSIFTFADPLTLCKYNDAQFVLLKSGNVVYIKTAAKVLEDSFCCFDPFDQNENFCKNDTASKEVLSQWPYLVIRENTADIKK
ncbi:unnamed protein product [Rotaria magnacalcarata]|uniref:Uncharacterized protein n=1 Tax=Rotaria magnacalcarata TaxID=392030 RepID=A0A816X8S3_9BILA|nr:unnamed protein product [Rotaria magnacalcarata]